MKYFRPGANPLITSYNASNVNFFNVNLNTKILFSTFKNAFAFFTACIEAKKSQLEGLTPVHNYLSCSLQYEK
jgi:hypothetical protein